MHPPQGTVPGNDYGSLAVHDDNCICSQYCLATRVPSVATACAAAADGLSTVIVDLDPQATASSWGDGRSFGHPVVLPAQPPRLPRVLDAAAGEGVELAVVDTAPRVEQSAVAAARAADLVVVPCRPAVYDLETVVGTLDVIRAVAPGVRTVCVLNGVPPRGPREGCAPSSTTPQRPV